jgi:uncharacterized membrane-anchored protein
MTLIFRDGIRIDKFIGLCKAKGLHGTIKRLDDRRQEVTVRLKNATARASLTATWASLTVEKN